MSQLESLPTPMTFSVTIADASNLPIYHVNALGLRASNDEFFFTLGVVTPPDQAEVAAATEAGWRKFIRMSTQRPGAESVLTVIPAERTTTAGPIFFKPALSPEDYEARI